MTTEISERLTAAQAEEKQGGRAPGTAWDEEYQKFVPLGELALRQSMNAPTDLAVNMEQFVEQRKQILKFVGSQMVEAKYDEKRNPVAGQMGDYYKVPGNDRKALTKKGAENMAQFFKIFAGPVKLESQTKEKEYVDATVSMTLVDRFGRIVGSAVSSCSSAEKRFQGFGSKWKYGGVFSKQQQEWTTAPDFRAALNDVTAMARKRCFVQAVIVATATDEIFEVGADRPETKEETAAQELVEQQHRATLPKRMPVGDHKDKPLPEVPADNLLKCIAWCGAKEKLQALREACEMELENRREEQEDINF